MSDFTIEELLDTLAILEEEGKVRSFSHKETVERMYCATEYFEDSLRENGYKESEIAVLIR